MLLYVMLITRHQAAEQLLVLALVQVLFEVSPIMIWMPLARQMPATCY